MTYFHETFWLAMSDGMMNYYNAHVWADANPHVIRQGRFESGFSIHLWTGILDGRRYLRFLHSDLPQFCCGEHGPRETRSSLVSV
jgi:hypothetical protein